jgi:hypothetical protein
MNEDTAQSFCEAAGKVLAELAEDNRVDDSVERVRRCTNAIVTILPMPLPPTVPDAVQPHLPPPSPPPPPPSQPETPKS